LKKNRDEKPELTTASNQNLTVVPVNQEMILADMPGSFFLI